MNVTYDINEESKKLMKSCDYDNICRGRLFLLSITLITIALLNETWISQRFTIQGSNGKVLTKNITQGVTSLFGTGFSRLSPLVEPTIPLHGGLNNSFSACLLVMDDNHRLVEWLAYHYFLMPLRHLVLLPDTKSRTSPMDIVNKWRQYLHIDVWNDDDFMNDSLRQFVTAKANSTHPGDGFLVHTHRQETFYRQCAIHLQKLNRTWTIFSDVDEYWVINEDVVSDWHSRMQEPGGILNLLQDIRELNRPDDVHYQGEFLISVH
jgi:hypothetical protein